MRIGRYEVGRVLGEGGAGKVYEAVLLGPDDLRMRVALKVLRSEALRREARIGGLLRHRNLVDVYEVGEHDGTWFCAMELCDGGTLDAHTPLPPRAVVQVGLQVCDALAYAHRELGLVHLDLKPRNLLLSGDVVKVADLGISRAEGFDDDGRVRGTPGYMAPEQVMGGAVDARADVYALGVTLAELATGARPRASQTIDSDAIEEVHASAATFVDLDFEEDGVPGWLAPAVERCLCTDPALRWPTMEALADALRSLQVQGPGLAAHLGLSEPVRSDPSAPVVGRDRALDALAKQLASPGLVTLKGPAGIGKSRLADAAAERWRGGAVWWVDLCDVRDQLGLVAAVGAALAVPLGAAGGTRTLGFALASRGPALLVLDNFEQILSLAPIVAGWCDAAPEARVLVTSQAPLGVPGERVVEVAPLSADASRQLLVEQARRRGADIVDDPDLPELITRLDGLPLALELAAGRLGVLGVRDVLDRLGPSLLRTGDDARHATLDGALDWSWDLLDDPARLTLAQLSVFEGGFTLAAAERVVQQTGTPVAEALATLVERSLVRVLPDARFTMLAPVRAHAAAKLTDPLGEARHGAWCAGLPASEAQAERLNLLAACHRAVERGDGEVAVATLERCWAVLRVLGPHATAAELAQRVSRLQGLSLALTLRASQVAAGITCDAGQPNRARPLYDQVLRLAGRVGDLPATAAALGGLGRIEQQTGHLEDAEVHLERALQIARDLGDSVMEAMFLRDLGNGFAMRGVYDRAIPLYEASVALFDFLGRRGDAGQVSCNLGYCLSEVGRVDDARACFARALAAARREGEGGPEAVALANLGGLERVQRRFDVARAHYHDAIAICRDLGSRAREGILTGHLALVEDADGHPDEAWDLARRALAVHQEVGAGRYEGHVRMHLAQLHLQAGTDEQARDQAQRALELGEDSGDLLLQRQALVLLVDLAGPEGYAERLRDVLRALGRGSEDP